MRCLFKIEVDGSGVQRVRVAPVPAAKRTGSERDLLSMVLAAAEALDLQIRARGR